MQEMESNPVANLRVYGGTLSFDGHGGTAPPSSPSSPISGAGAFPRVGSQVQPRRRRPSLCQQGRPLPQPQVRLYIG